LFHGVGQSFTFDQVDLEPGPGEALIEVGLTTICGSDLHTIAGRREQPTPLVLGHETVGRVTAIGEPAPHSIDGVTISPGDRVVWGVVISCGHCDKCRSEIPQKCRNLVKYGHVRAQGRGRLMGGFASHVMLGAGTSIAIIGAGLPDEAWAPVSCATATAVAAVEAAGDISAKTVLILGAGPLGLAACAIASDRGASVVTVVDPVPSRAETATRFGATDISSRATGHSEVVLEMSGSDQAVAAAFDHAEVGSSIVLVGSVMPGKQLDITAEGIVRRLLRVVGVHNYAPHHLAEAVGYVSQSKRPFADLVEVVFNLNEVEDAVALAMEGGPPRVGLRP
jgi:putative phosphonate catabolism associated alcohol dehydrogenase